MFNKHFVVTGDFEQIALDIHRLISIEISNNFYYYDDNQKLVFKYALNLIDQLDLILQSKHEIKVSYFKTYKILFATLKLLGIDETISNKISKLKTSIC